MQALSRCQRAALHGSAFAGRQSGSARVPVCSRGLAQQAAQCRVARTYAALKEVTLEVDAAGRERVKYDESGWNFWQWKGRDGKSQHRIHWVAAGPQDAPAVVLVHGYGASAYHWRYNIATLAKQYRVYAVCMLGFGWSDKAVVDYTNGKQWVGQLTDFIEQVVGGKPVALVGNSLGAYASLATAAARPDLVRGVAMLNGAGPLQEPGKPVLDPDAQPSISDQFMYTMTGMIKRVVLFFAFLQAKSPGRIKEVLDMVYVTKSQVDEDLVKSIVKPAEDPRASHVFYLLNHRMAPPVTLNMLLAKMSAPILLLWGMRDPWMTPARAVAIQQLYPAAQFVPLPTAGHCPHDDCPDEANTALMTWLQGLPTATAPVPLTTVAERLRVTL